MELSSSDHGKVHGLTNILSSEMSIRREILFELTKKIPLDKHIEVLSEVVNEIKRKGWFGRGRGKTTERVVKKEDIAASYQIEEELQRYADAEYEKEVHS